jgi:hypothetical protein
LSTVVSAGCAARKGPHEKASVTSRAKPDFMFCDASAAGPDKFSRKLPDGACGTDGPEDQFRRLRLIRQRAFTLAALAQRLRARQLIDSETSQHTFVVGLPGGLFTSGDHFRQRISTRRD